MAAMEKNKTNLNVPNLRFPEFRGEWEKYKLDEIATISKERIGVGMLSSSNYISTENMKSNFGGVDLTASLPVSGNVIKFQQGDTLLSNIRPYLKKIWQARFDGGCSADILVFRSNKLCNQDFLYYTLANEKFISYAMSGAKGVKMPRGDKEQILKYELHLPTATEQNKITSLLSLLDQRIKTQKKVIEDLKRLKYAISKRVFSEMGQHHPVVKLGQLCSIKTGKLDANAMIDNGEFPFFTCAREDYRTDTYAFEGDSLLISGNGDIGIVKRYNGKFNAYQRTYVLQDFIQEIAYVQCFVEHHLPKRVLKEKNVGAMPYIVLSTLSEMPIILPPTYIQNAICKTIGAISEQINVEEKILANFELQKQYNLSMMFI